VTVGAIDIGTNTALLLVAEVIEGRITPVVDEERFVRLGDGVDASRMISVAAEVRLIEALTEYRAIVDRHRVELIDVVATSAFRDARNRDEVARRVIDRTGFEMRAISGDVEAELTFLGGLSRLPASDEQRLTLDIGGGSTEMTFGRIDDEGVVRIDHGASTPCGAIRIRERFFPTIPPSEEQIGQAQVFIDAAFAPSRDQVRSNEIIGTSGTTCALAILAHGRLAHESDGELRPVELTRGQVGVWLERLMKLGEEEVLALNPTVMSGRADVFGAGLLVLDRAMEAAGAERLVVSDGGLRHGVALRMAGV
jgi:exopolyphosphatase / guanosine-5'-triphosphate,3'-diphosphate pyrophosphatase